MTNVQEIWKDINEFEGIYSISNFGKVKSHRRSFVQKHRSGKIYNNIIPDCILKPILGKRGYHTVSLQLNKKIKRTTIHRLIAIHFIPNPENKPHINHKNGVKTDNRIENLEWCTNQENIQHSYDFLNRRKRKFKKGKEHHMARKVKQLSINGDYLRSFDTMTDAEKYTGIPKTQITAVCRKKRTTTGGYRWEYTA